MVTGASTGIGRAIVETALARGAASVFANVRKAEDAAALVESFGARVVPVVFDVCDEAGVEAGARQVEAALGNATLAGLVNNAGVAVPGPLLHVETKDLARQLDVNLLGVHRVTRAFAPLLGAGPGKSGPKGRIVMMSSVGGRVAAPFNGSYNASKFALEGYSSALRKELMLYGVDVIVVGPGAIRTPIWEKSDAAEFHKYANTPYAPSIKRARDYMLKLGAHGLEAEVVADVVWTALTAAKPKPRYAVVPSKWRDFLMRHAPTRAVDKRTAAFLGFPVQA
jgi:NAD(P)-dependent dehydrogenase (short-subunit alcohol dehydrogenase family)